MKYRRFDSLDCLEDDAAELVRAHACMAPGHAHAVMFTGGKTPLGLYARLTAAAIEADTDFHSIVSDERHVPIEAPESNFGRMAGMLLAMRVPEDRVIRVHTELPLMAAADLYDFELQTFLKGKRGTVTLGILGLGADGHVASLFSPDDIDRGSGRYAMAVPRGDGPDRVSVTRDLLLEVDRLVFIVAGRDKSDIVSCLVTAPESIPAGVATQGARSVEVWHYAGEREK